MKYNLKEQHLKKINLVIDQDYRLTLNHWLIVW